MSFRWNQSSSSSCVLSYGSVYHEKKDESDKCSMVVNHSVGMLSSLSNNQLLALKSLIKSHCKVLWVNPN